MNNGENHERRSSTPNPINILVQVSLRVLIIGTALASLALMITNHQVASVYGIAFEAKYNYSASFRFLVFAQIAVCAHILVSMVLVFLAVRRGGLVFALFMIDLIDTVVEVSAFSAAMSEGYIGKYGNTHAGWLPICSYVHGYCNRVVISLVMCFVSFILQFILTVLTASAARHT